MSPFAHREDIARVEPLYATFGTGKSAPARRPVGATVTFRATPGMTAPWLQRVVDCHIARNDAVGHDAPEMAYCPLLPRNVTATVTESSGGFDVAIRSEDAATVSVVLQKAEALVGR